ncbi:MAG: Wzz/FepE/Etk N-terminal domain-containing protein [Acidobacteriaceae bacterium]
MLGHRKLTSQDYIAILKRRRWLIALPVIVLPIIAIGITYLIPSQYVSQTLVLIQQPQVSSDIAKAVVTGSLDTRLASMKEQILSRSRIQPIIERYNLFASKAASMDDRLDLTRKAIKVTPIKSDITRAPTLPGFYITFTANDARTAQLVCAEITSLFINENLRSRENSAQGASDFLKGQLEDAKRSLDDQDAKLAAFQRQYGGKLPSEEASSLNMLTSLNTQLESSNQALARMVQDKTYQESMLSQQLQSAPPPTPTGTIQTAPQAQQVELQRLLTEESDLAAHYTSDHPDVIAKRRQIAELRKKMAQTPAPIQTATNIPLNAAPSQNDSLSTRQLRSAIRAADIGIQEKKREQDHLQSNIGVYQNRIASTPGVAAQYKDLTRDYDTAQKFYDDLLAKANQQKMATDLERRNQGEQFTLMDSANLPDSPTFPVRWMFGAAGLGLGLLLGLALAAFKEYKDTALRTEQDVWAFTQLPTLAVIAFSKEVDSGVEERSKPRGFMRFFGRKAPVSSLSKAHG